MADMPTRYYRITAAPPSATVFFRVASGGRFDRWDPATKAWVHVTSGPARDWFSAAIENGECIQTTANAIH